MTSKTSIISSIFITISLSACSKPALMQDETLAKAAHIFERNGFRVKNSWDSNSHPKDLPFFISHQGECYTLEALSDSTKLYKGCVSIDLNNGLTKVSSIQSLDAPRH